MESCGSGRGTGGRRRARWGSCSSAGQEEGEEKQEGNGRETRGTVVRE